MCNPSTRIFVVVFLLSALPSDMSYSAVIMKNIKDLDRREILQEILWRFFLIRPDRVNKDIGFLVYPGGKFTTSAGQVIKFNTVDRNDGNGYSPSTGMFVAPVAGLYHFYWNILSYKGKGTSIYLMVNGKLKLRSAILAEQTYERPGGSVYLRLRKGDKVYLMASGSGGIIQESRHSTFGGELIRY